MYTQEEIINLLQKSQIPFWNTYDFWIFLVLAILSLIASILAYFAANKAKDAAINAGKTVKIQTVIIDLNEIMFKLSSVTIGMKFQEARDLINETNRKVLRIITPFNSDDEYTGIIEKIIKDLNQVKSSLEEVKTIDNLPEKVETTVYYAVEGIISSLTGHLAELMGKFEGRTINI